MKRFALTLLFGCLALAAAVQDKGRVVRVKDGDTYVLKVGRDTLTIRLAAVDAPELNQAFGLDAFYCVRDTLLGRMVSFKKLGTDRYGRTLADVFLPDGKLLSELLIGNGWAWHYTEYDHNPKLDDLQKQAIEKGLGLWACGVKRVCPPWLFREYGWRNRLRYCKGCGFPANPKVNMKARK